MGSSNSLEATAGPREAVVAGAEGAGAIWEAGEDSTGPALSCPSEPHDQVGVARGGLTDRIEGHKEEEVLRWATNCKWLSRYSW